MNFQQRGLTGHAGAYRCGAAIRTPFRHCRIGGLDIVTASRADLTEALLRDCLEARNHGLSVPPRLIFDVNGHALSLRETNPAYRQALDQADVLHADGGFLVTLSRLITKTPIAERSATTDLIHDMARVAVPNGLSFYLLGGSESLNRRCAERLLECYPGLRIAGRNPGYFDESEEAAIVEEINRAQPDLVWVGMGKPREQQFCVRWRERIRAGWVLTCGGCFHFVTGDYRRAPPWMQRNNLEWLHRVAGRPRSLFWRYAITNPHALWIVMRRAGR